MESIRCPGCGSPLYYKMGEEHLKCNYCGSLISVEEEKITDKEYVESRLMEVHVSTCPNCEARLMSDRNTMTVNCAYCGSALIYDNRVNRAFKPEKILPYEISLEDAKKITKRYFVKNEVLKNYMNEIDNLKQIYVPYWLYNVEFIIETKNKKGQIETSKECVDNILLDASSKIDDTLSRKFSDDFDLSKLRNFEIPMIAGYLAEEFDVSGKSIYQSLLKKLEKKYYGKINYEKENHTFILLPFYFLKIGQIQVLVNGQTGRIEHFLVETIKFTSKKIDTSNFIHFNEMTASELKDFKLKQVVLRNEAINRGAQMIYEERRKKNKLIKKIMSLDEHIFLYVSIVYLLVVFFMIFLYYLFLF